MLQNINIEGIRYKGFVSKKRNSVLVSEGVFPLRYIETLSLTLSQKEN
jgi:hypothetical protein